MSTFGLGDRDAAFGFKRGLLGSSVTYGYDSIYHDEVRDRVWVSAGIDETNESLQQAIISYVNVFGTVFATPNGMGIPLSRVSIQRVGPTKAMIAAHFRRRRWNFIPNRPEEIAKFAVGSEYEEVYRRSDIEIPLIPPGEITPQDFRFDFGLPNGDWADGEPRTEWADLLDLRVGRPKKVDEQRVPVMKMSVPTRLSQSPLENIFFLQGTTNLSDVKFGGQPGNPFIFAPNTVRFDAAITYWIEGNGGIAGATSYWITEYQFTIRPTGWVKQTIVKQDPGTEDDTALFRTDFSRMYESYEFVGAFPFGV